ncbi:MAG TPA: peptide ABC transporter substrate-binding protein [Candidatus Baltobacteraceae bacterium]|nr:peptide ABC transporter substrate-binding protein [Candidatus Baltobacteraceae bacterium]
MTALRTRVLAAAVAIVLTAACSKPTQTNAPSAPANGILRVANWAEPNSLNPLLISNTAENFIASLIFDELVTIDDKGNDVPDLAAQVPTLRNRGISPDGRTITYKLRRNVRWHDGVPFTSADVKFSWQAVMNPNNNVVERRGYDQVSSVDTPDGYTVVFHLKQPFSPFIDTVFGESDDPFRIIPKHVLGSLPNINKAAFNSAPIGTGPFKFVRWVHGDHVQLAANDDYFRGKPRLRGIVVQTVVEDNTKTAMLRSHGTDLIVALSAAAYRILRGNPNVRILFIRAPSYTSIDFNFTRPPLNDLRVRKAIAHTIDNKRIVTNLTYGTARVATADLSDFYWAFDPSLAPVAYDLSQANALLDAAGWKRGANGVRAKNGTPLSLQLVYGQGSETARQIAVQVQSDLAQAGISVLLKPYLYNMLYATQQEGGVLSNGRFDLAEWSWVAGADPDDSSQWMCDQIPPKGNNNGHYCNPQVDAAERDALSTFDRAKRKAQYAVTQSLLLKDAAASFIYYPRLRYAMNPALQNFRPNGPSEGWNAYQWSF